jgi:hypothetical protein
MITKLSTFRGVSEEGEPLVRLFDPGISLTKQAGEMMPEVRRWLDAYKPQPGKIAVLVNALGASEYWGQNVNGDVFPESALVHDCANHPGQQHPYDEFAGKVIPPYGAWTFMNAHPFVHHRNKDPNRAFGKVVLWCWNPRMHRVELVILLDTALALQHGAQHVIDRILAGEYPDCSMGCRVPYDICTICGHKSKTRRDYCTCITQFGMGKFLDDGRRVGVINTYPRFFDISFVFIGADKTAKMMAKLGSGLWVPQSVVDAEMVYGAMNDDGQELVKAASVDLPDAKTRYESKSPQGKSEYQEWARRANARLRAKTDKARASGAKGIPSLSRLLKKEAQVEPPHHRYSSAADRILASKPDDQENIERRALADGNLKTNADVNETDEFPQPLTPGPGKTAAINPKLLHGLIGAGIGGTAGAALGDDNRVAGGLIGAGLGALGGVGLGHLGRIAGLETGVVAQKRLLQKSKRDLEVLVKTRDQLEMQAGLVNRHHKMRMKDLGDEIDSLAFSGTANPRDVMRAQKLNTSRLMAQEKFEAQRVALRGKYSDLNDKINATTGAIQSLEQAVPVREKIWGGALGLGGATLGGVAGGGYAGEATKVSSGLKKLWQDAANIKIGPPPKPNRREYPFTGTIDFHGLMIHVENKPGTYREGKGWRTLMRIPYGEFLGTRGVDKDKLDVYVGPYRDAPNVYIIHQNFVRGRKKDKYDEDKVMVGFKSLEQAKAAYLAHYDSPDYFRSATVMAFPLFKRAIIRKEVHGEKVASEYVHTMEKRAEDLKLEDLFLSSKTAGRRSKVWRHSDGTEYRKSGSGMDNWGETKLASVKVAAPSPHELLKMSEEKWADIVKNIGPDKAVGQVSPLLSDSEPDLSKGTLNAMADRGLGKALSTSSLMGMVLKPREFQRICLRCMGKDSLADDLDDAGAVFRPSDSEVAPCQELSAEGLDPRLLEMLMPLMGEKSYFGPVVRKRIIRIVLQKPTPVPKDTSVNSPLLSKVASAYTWYRREQMKLAADAMTVVPNIPSLHAGLYGIGDEDLFGKTASKVVDHKTLGVVLGAVPLTLMYSAHLRGKRRKGEELGMLSGLVADHPWLATAGMAAVLREAMKNPKANQAVSELVAAGKRIWKGAPTQSAS